VPNCGIATAIDIGDANNVHPKNKQELGRRLALVARHLVYHEKVEDSGPIYSSITVSRGKITIHFTHIGGGLITQDALAPKGFAIAGSDRKWYWGDAHIVGDTIVVSSPNVTTPAAVRYAWAGGPTGNVASRDGLPMFPFRTDQFRLLTDRDHTKQ
jgi:sialate O-acetylesterase